MSSANGMKLDQKNGLRCAPDPTGHFSVSWNPAARRVGTQLDLILQISRVLAGRQVGYPRPDDPEPIPARDHPAGGKLVL